MVFEPFFDGIDQYPVVIAGPCSAETERQVLDTAVALKRLGIEIFRAGIWKPRTRPGSFEGVGERGLDWLALVRRETGMRVVTEVASREHVFKAFEAGIDGVWIGARTSANPFAVQEIADSLEELAADIPVLIKNPVNPDLALWIGAIERIYSSGTHRIAAVHRGFSSYVNGKYRNPPHWALPIELSHRFPGLMLLHDPSHTSGNASMIERLCLEALDLCFSGLMIEVHPNPEKALSDAAQQITPAKLGTILKGLRDTLPSHCTDSRLSSLRSEIDELDAELIKILVQRMELCRRIGKIKKESDLPVVQPERYARLLDEILANGVKKGLDPSVLKKIFSIIHEYSVALQLGIKRDS